MGFKVVGFNDGVSEFDEADGYKFEEEGTLTVQNADAADIASFAPGYWYSIVKIPTSDKQLQLEEALELISLVDNGNYTNQDADWCERADALLSLKQQD